MDRLGQITMRINQAKPLTTIDILAGHGAHKTGFTGSRLTDDVYMKQPVCLTHTKQPIWRTAPCLTNRGDDFSGGFHKRF